METPASPPVPAAQANPLAPGMVGTWPRSWPSLLLSHLCPLHLRLAQPVSLTVLLADRSCGTSDSGALQSPGSWCSLSLAWPEPPCPPALSLWEEGIINSQQTWRGRLLTRTHGHARTMAPGEAGAPVAPPLAPRAGVGSGPPNPSLELRSPNCVPSSQCHRPLVVQLGWHRLILTNLLMSWGPSAPPSAPSTVLSGNPGGDASRFTRGRGVSGRRAATHGHSDGSTGSKLLSLPVWSGGLLSQASRALTWTQGCCSPGLQLPGPPGQESPEDAPAGPPRASSLLSAIERPKRKSKAGARGWGFFLKHVAH